MPGIASKVLNASGKGGGALRAMLIEPRSLGEDSRRREYILNVILVGAIILLFLLDIQVLVRTLELGDGYKGVPFDVFTGILLFFAGLLVLSRRGYFAGAAYVFLLVFFSAASYGAYRWGADLQETLLSYAFLIVAASILIGTRFGFVMTGIIALTLLPLWYLQTAGRLRFDRYWTSQPGGSDALVFVLMFGAIALISWLSNREIERSLDRARRSEAALQAEKDLLEVKVEDRTRELRELQLERMNQLARLAEAGRMAAGMVHDLLNPLTVVSLSMEEMERSGHGTGEAQASLANAIRASRRMENLIAMARRHMGQREMRTDFSATDEVREILQLFSYKAKQAGVEFRFHDPGEVGMFGDPLKFGQVTANLVSNAIDAYDGLQGGDKYVEIKLDKAQGKVVLAVADRGAGIPAGNLEDIFNPFFTTKPVDKGTGLGLATAKSLVEHEFGGRLLVRSQYGEGSVFTAEFPL